MVFREHGFKTGTVRFPGLNLVLKLDQDRYFRDYGVVKDIDYHMENVLTELGVSDYQCSSLGLGISYGRHIPLRSGDAKASLILVRDHNPETNSFNYGHESTHALIYLGLEEHFMRLLRARGFALDPFTRDDEESIANVGGLLSFHHAHEQRVFAGHPELGPIVRELMASKRNPVTSLVF